MFMFGYLKEFPKFELFRGPMILQREVLGLFFCLKALFKKRNSFILFLFSLWLRLEKY